MIFGWMRTEKYLVYEVLVTYVLCA